MLNTHILKFLNYCKTVNFSEKSLEALTCRLGEFNDYIKQNQIRSVKNIKYSDLLEFLADYHTPSNHVKKSRVWTLKRFFRFLKTRVQVISATVISEFLIFISTSTYEYKNETGALYEIQTNIL